MYNYNRVADAPPASSSKHALFTQFADANYRFTGGFSLSQKRLRFWEPYWRVPFHGFSGGYNPPAETMRSKAPCDGCNRRGVIKRAYHALLRFKMRLEKELQYSRIMTGGKDLEIWN